MTDHRRGGEGVGVATTGAITGLRGEGWSGGGQWGHEVRRQKGDGRWGCEERDGEDENGLKDGDTG